jgi:hypothetical protein
VLITFILVQTHIKLGLNGLLVLALLVEVILLLFQGSIIQVDKAQTILTILLVEQVEQVAMEPI